MSGGGLPERVFARLDTLAALCGPAFLIGLSGGSDSTALMALARLWALRSGGRVSACVVDHGLRPGSAAEAEAVAARWRPTGVPVTIQRWEHPAAATDRLSQPPRQASQALARAARHRLLAATARSQAAGVILLGHTADDQAETVALRLVRGTGPDGLAGMSQLAPSPADGWEGAPVLARPLLELSRAVLRDWLMSRGMDWLEDPSNHQRRFARVAVRERLARLAQAKAAPERLVTVASQALRLRRALDTDALALARRATVEGPQITVPLPATAPAGPVAQRVTAWALAVAGQSAAGSSLPGPIDPMQITRLLIRVSQGRPANLAGALVRPVAGGICVGPEPPRRGRRLEPVPPALAGRWAHLLHSTQLALDMDQAHPPGGCA